MNQTSPDPLSVQQKLSLQFLRDIFEVASAVNSRTYIWGGMVIDIISGEFLRDHHDIDGFTLNLNDHKHAMMAMFSRRGYTVSYADKFGMLQINMGDMHAAFNQLQIDDDTAQWQHVGDQGTVYFPYLWLDPTPRSFYDVCVYTSGLRFEYAIKTNVHLLNPEWQFRFKDRSVIRYLEAAMSKTGINPVDILPYIWSYTPFWVDKGYPEYAKPVRISTPEANEDDSQ